jgi:hypothetical protein
MLRIICNEENWAAAEKYSNQLPIYKNSHRETAANQVGTLGEVIAEKWLKESGIIYRDERSTTTHDYRLPSNQTIDVKTKDRTVEPRQNYDCSVPLYNHDHQRPDFYLFASLQRDASSKSNDIRRFTRVFILGFADQALLKEKGKIWKKGETDPANGTKFWTDCINLKIGDLKSLNEALVTWS